MLDTYEVTSATFAVIAINETLSRVIEREKELFINKSTIDIIEDSCKYYGCTYEGRCEGTRNLLNYSYKLPIMIEESKSLIFFPTASPKFAKCSWLSLHDIDKFYRHGESTLILFKNGYSLVRECAFETIENQLMRATRLDCVMKERKNK